MLIIHSDSFNPYKNLAIEEVLLKRYSENILFVYRNKPSIIVGKHQNALAEINFWHLKEHNIPVVRRLSGGGTVYHDLGNVNFTFFENAEEGRLVDFKKYTSLIIDFLKMLGLDAFFGGHNDIRTKEYKLSGNAEHVHKNRVMHHGTLLFNSEITQLRETLKNNPDRYADKAVKSVPAKVNTISQLLNALYPVEEFIELIIQYFTSEKNGILTVLNEQFNNEVESLIKDKYSTWDWNFGYSPRYAYKNSFMANNAIFELALDVARGGLIERAFITKTVENKTEQNELSFLQGTKHQYENLTSLFTKTPAITELTGLNAEQLIFHFF